eukprot:Colp12_sorted_trinity150504_noHs@24638
MSGFYKDVSANKKPSRAAKRREKKEQAAKDHEQAVAENSNVVSASAQETEAIQKKLAALGLEIKKIAPDGHCLYCAVSDQLKLIDINLDFKTLRKSAATYISTHANDFLPFLVNDNGDMMTPEDFKNYLHRLEHSSDWGGELELQAIAHVLKLPIEVIQASAASHILGTEYKGQPLRLSYHRHEYSLGAHYNSVVPAKIA